MNELLVIAFTICSNAALVILLNNSKTLVPFFILSLFFYITNSKEHSRVLFGKIFLIKIVTPQIFKKMSKINLFISYAHADARYFRELKNYVNNTNCPGVEVWDDGEIQAGDTWDDAIKTKLAEADIILLMISQDFLNSTYVNQVELTSALQRHELKQCRVVPVFTKTCVLDNHKHITRLQGLPAGMKFLSELGEQVYSQYAEIQRTVTELALEIATDKNIRSSIQNNDEQCKDAKEIETLTGKGKIFLSIPDSVEGKKKRRALIIQADGKIKYEEWPYEIVPSEDEAEALLQKTPDEIKAACKTYMQEAVYSVQIMHTENDFDSGIAQMQYQLAGAIQKEKPFHKRIVWMLSSDLKTKVSKEICMDPIFPGNDFEFLFDMIKNFDEEKSKKINDLKNAFSPGKKVFMFYDFEKDHNNALRIQLKAKIEEKENIAVLFNLPGGTPTEDKEELEKCDGAFIFYGAADPLWFLYRQRTLLASDHTRSKGVCVDEPEMDVKINRDVSRHAFITIRGNNDFDNGIQTFLEKLNS